MDVMTRAVVCASSWSGYGFLHYACQRQLTLPVGNFCKMMLPAEFLRLHMSKIQRVEGTTRHSRACGCRRKPCRRAPCRRALPHVRGLHRLKLHASWCFVRELQVLLLLCTIDRLAQAESCPRHLEVPEPVLVLCWDVFHVVLEGTQFWCVSCVSPAD